MIRTSHGSQSTHSLPISSSVIHLYAVFTRLFLQQASDEMSFQKWYAFTILPMAYEALRLHRPSLFDSYETFIASLPPVEGLSSDLLFKLAIVSVLITRAHAEAVQNECGAPLSYKCFGEEPSLHLADEILRGIKPFTGINVDSFKGKQLVRGLGDIPGLEQRPNHFYGSNCAKIQSG